MRRPPTGRLAAAAELHVDLVEAAGDIQVDRVDQADGGHGDDDGVVLGSFRRLRHRADNRRRPDLAVGVEAPVREGLEDGVEVSPGSVGGAFRPPWHHHVKPTRLPGGETSHLLDERAVVAAGGSQHQVPSHANLRWRCI
jgi:hypothetical protein